MEGGGAGDCESTKVAGSWVASSSSSILSTSISSVSSKVRCNSGGDVLWTVEFGRVFLDGGGGRISKDDSLGLVFSERGSEGDGAILGDLCLLLVRRRDRVVFVDVERELIFAGSRGICQRLRVVSLCAGEKTGI